MKRIGYLVPEFPGQTHNFFWREIQALRNLGIDVNILSTRLPPVGLMSTSWGDQAVRTTTYLYPPSLTEIPVLVSIIVLAGPRAWYRCLRCILSADGTSTRQRARMLGLILMSAKLVRTARRQGWRHVHVHSCADSANVALLAKWLNGIDYSLTLHGALAIYGGNQKQKWGHASFGIVITQALLKEVQRTLLENLPTRVEVAPMGVNVSVFARTRPYQPYEGVGALRVFCCGRLNPGKGHRYLIEAMGQLRQNNVDATLEIAGEDESGGSGYRRELEALIHSRGLEDRIRLLGAVSEEIVRERLMEAHVFALASLDEALGVALMEAMSMEVPVIATRVGGVPELISDGLDGILVPPGDSVLLAQAMTSIAADPRRAREIGKDARRKVADLFSVDRSAKMIMRLVTVNE